MSNPIELSIREVIELEAALKNLVGHEEDGKTVRYSFDEKTKWNITKNLRLLREEVELAGDRRNEKIRELSPENLNIAKEEPKVRGAFEKWHTGFLRTKVAVSGLLKVKRTALTRPGEDGFPKNNIPEETLLGVFPIIEDDAT